MDGTDKGREQVETFYIQAKSGEHGPYTVSQLRTMWDCGAITADAMIRQSGWSDWTPVTTILGVEPADSHGTHANRLDQGTRSRARSVGSSAFRIGCTVLLLLFFLVAIILAVLGAKAKSHAERTGESTVRVRDASNSQAVQELTKKRTAEAWEELGACALAFSQESEEEPWRVLSLYSELCLRIDLTGVDPELSSHIRKHIAFSSKAAQDMRQVHIEASEASKGVDGAAALGALFGGLLGAASEDENPEAAAFLGGMVGGQAARETAESEAIAALARKWAPVMEKHAATIAALEEERNSLVVRLNNRYGGDLQ